MPPKGVINPNIRDENGKIIPWKKRNKELSNKTARERHKKRTLENPEYERLQRRKWFVKFKFGITLELRELLINLQDNKCAICNKFIPIESSEWAVDHEHTKNYVRGMLCKGCNSALGLFKDNPETLRKAAEYIEITNTITNDPSIEDFKEATRLLEISNVR